MKLLADQSSNAKLSKNAATTDEWQTSIMYLSPSDSSGLREGFRPVNLCPAASPGCRAACLNTAGRGAMGSVQAGRLRKTRLYVQDRAEFNRQLAADLLTLVNRQRRTGVLQAVRLNGTSDVAWEEHQIERDGILYAGVPQAFPELQFYDYTKMVLRAQWTREGSWPRNYHLTFSRSEVNDGIVNRLLSSSINIAVVFGGSSLPATWNGREVIDGTLHDMRFLDPPGCIVGLLAKGRARKDGTGFAFSLNEGVAV